MTIHSALCNYTIETASLLIVGYKKKDTKFLTIRSFSIAKTKYTRMSTPIDWFSLLDYPKNILIALHINDGNSNLSLGSARMERPRTELH